AAGAPLAFAATFSLEPLRRWVGAWLAELGQARPLRLAGYGQLLQELRAPDAFRGAAACVGLLSFADWQRAGAGCAAGFDAARFRTDLRLLLESVESALEWCPGLLLVVCPARPAAAAGPERPRLFAEGLEQLQQLSQQQPRLRVLSPSELAAWYPVEDPHDVMADSLGHVPYTEPMWCALGAAAVRMLLPALAPPLKAVVVDCDYTLWHGAVAEVGPAGLVCGPRHLELQERLLALRSTGVLLCLCSRNAEADVWEALENGEMLLRREHVTRAWLEVGGAPKSRGLLEMAGELHVAPESVLFVDDNPAECAEVRAALPEVPVWCVPQRHAEFRQQLSHVWRLDVGSAAAAGSEGGRRADFYRQDADRRALRAGAASLSEFHRQLQVKIAFQDHSQASSSSRERFLQLHERTNQFNAWKRCPVPPDAVERCEGLLMTVEDRYGDYGLVGAALCQRRGDRLAVISFTMSCRVLGRGAEHALLAELGRLALRPPRCRVVAVGTARAARNQPVLRFLQRASNSLADDAQRAGCAAETGELAASGSGLWEHELPERWHFYDAERLSGLEFDPDAEAADAAEAAKAEGWDGAPGEAPPAGAVQPDLHEEQRRRRLCDLAEALTRMPLDLRTVQQAMRRRGCELGPPVEQAGASDSARALQLLRAIWRSVLQLGPPGAEGEAEDHQDDVPFASLGGDSTLAVQLISMAARHGLQLPHDLNVEMATIGKLAQRCSVCVGAPLAQRAGAGDGSGGAQKGLRILERDGRNPSGALSALGGISACAEGRLEEAQQLAARGWHPAYAVDKHRNTALMWASGCGHLPVARWLLEEVGVGVDVGNKDGRTALMWACKNRQFDSAEYLLYQAGADVSIRMKDDSSAFDWAVLGGDLPTMELLASHPGVDIKALNKFGCAAVQWAAASGNIETCRWLHSKGLDFAHLNQARHGAVNKAAWKGHQDLLHWLLVDPGGPLLIPQLLMPDLDGRSVAELARMGGHAQVANWLEELAAHARRQLGADGGSDMLAPEEAARMKSRCLAR
ncbi:unnamed protein product, partial [Prorocentrum cordatum]